MGHSVIPWITTAITIRRQFAINRNQPFPMLATSGRRSPVANCDHVPLLVDWHNSRSTGIDNLFLRAKPTDISKPEICRHHALAGNNCPAACVRSASGSSIGLELYQLAARMGVESMQRDLRAWRLQGRKFPAITPAPKREMVPNRLRGHGGLAHHRAHLSPNMFTRLAPHPKETFL